MQLLIGATIFNGGPGAEVLSAHGHFDAAATWVLGVAAAIPLIQLGRKVETSESQEWVELNAATNQLALRIFGARQQPLTALVVCGALGALVGTVEETLFRGQVLPAMAQYFADHGHGTYEALLMSVLASSVAFGAAHISIFSGLDSVMSKSTAATLAMQSGAGLWLALVALMPGAGLGAAIVAHGVYDAYTLFSTHMIVTGQYSHAAELARDTASTAAARAWRSRKGQPWVERCAYAFHLLDMDRSGGLSEIELRTGASTHGVELNDGLLHAHFAHLTPAHADIGFGEFLKLVEESEQQQSEAAAAAKQS